MQSKAEPSPKSEHSPGNPTPERDPNPKPEQNPHRGNDASSRGRNGPPGSGSGVSTIRGMLVSVMIVPLILYVLH